MRACGWRLAAGTTTMGGMGALAVALLVAIATGLGVVWRARQGRATEARGEASDLAAPGAGVTLVQVSTPVCAPCRSAHRVLGALAANTPGVAHVDVDAAERPEVARRFGILSTPTTLLVDSRGAVRARILGVPNRAALATRLNDLLEETRV